MTSTFGPDFNFDFGPNNNEPPSGNQEIFTYSPWLPTGLPTFYNWLGANRSTYDGAQVSSNDRKPGVAADVFSGNDITQGIDSDGRLQSGGPGLPADAVFKTERPKVYHGENKTKSPEKIYVSLNGAIEDLFKHTYNDRPRYEMCWRGHYSAGSGWYQFFNACVINSTDNLYPFATKGISCRLRVPGGDDEIIAGGKGDGDNYGNNMQINRAFGLWRDLEGAYYVYPMYPHGDNRYKALGSGSENDDDGDDGKVRPKKNDSSYPDRVKQSSIDWWGDRYWFLDLQPPFSSNNTYDTLEKNMIAKGKEKGLIIYTLEDVSELYFCGFSLEFHHNRAAGSKRNHSYLISRLMPVPYYSPRHDPRYRAVLGEPTPLEELREGKKRIHFWNPPQSYYEWSDDLSYDDSPPKEDGDTVEGDFDTVSVDPSTIFVNEDGDGIPIPNNIFLTDDYEIIVNNKGQVTTTDGSDYIIQSIADEYSD